MTINCKKNARDMNGLSKEDQKQLESDIKNPSNLAGLSGTTMIEPVPKFNQADCEVVFKNDHNAWIVLGRDRPASRASGHGGEGATGAGTIDLVVGRMSWNPKSDIYVDPNFESDAARIYISQRTDIDKNFQLVKGGVGDSKAKSGIGIKADAVRIMGREGIKIVAGTSRSKRNSAGGKVHAQAIGIDLLGTNDDSVKIKSFKKVKSLQHLVKGENLVDAMEILVDEIVDLNQRLNSFVTEQMRYNKSLATHTHISAPAGPTTPSGEAISAYIPATVKQFMNCSSKDWPQRINLNSFKNNFLTDTYTTYILSRHNRTT